MPFYFKDSSISFFLQTRTVISTIKRISQVKGLKLQNTNVEWKNVKLTGAD